MAIDSATSAPLVCPGCKGQLEFATDRIRCTLCAKTYLQDTEIADFAEGRYYDAFTPGDVLGSEHGAGLGLEESGAAARAAFYLALLPPRAPATATRILDCGCGNGLVVDHLRAAGFEAWGNDNSALRKWQWRERASRTHLVVADGNQLPFSDAYFDVVICSGVLEHIGVDEQGGSSYTVAPRPTRDAERARFLAEVLRVTRPGGVVFLDFPNGAFPIDFWHGVHPGAPRWHSLREGFLPTEGEVKELLRRLEANVRVRCVSPRGRLAFRQVSTRVVGRLLAPFGRALFWLLDRRVASRLRRTWLNPFLILQLDKR
jgi:SAM-dependent methyltransferase